MAHTRSVPVWIVYFDNSINHLANISRFWSSISLACIGHYLMRRVFRFMFFDFSCSHFCFSLFHFTRVCVCVWEKFTVAQIVIHGPNCENILWRCMFTFGKSIACSNFLVGWNDVCVCLFLCVQWTYNMSILRKTRTHNACTCNNYNWNNNKFEHRMRNTKTNIECLARMNLMDRERESECVSKILNCQKRASIYLTKNSEQNGYCVELCVCMLRL